VPARRTAELAKPAFRFFLDRSLGSKIVPDALRAAGWVLETMDERYGADESQHVKDDRWIEEAADKGDVLLCKDLRIAENPLEAAVVNRTSARVFGLARRDISGETMAAYFLDNERGIFRMSKYAAGPYVVSVSRNGLRRIRLNLR
jgi:hypothetical protein